MGWDGGGGGHWLGVPTPAMTYYVFDFCESSLKSGNHAGLMSLRLRLRFESLGSRGRV
jgi:hypothetical protein